nr:hypothetical protein [uncultured Tolumonas sp.]
MGKVIVYKFFIFDPTQKRTTLSNVFITKNAGGCLDLLDTSALEIDDSELNSDGIYVPSSDRYFLSSEHEDPATQKTDVIDNYCLLSTE